MSPSSWMASPSTVCLSKGEEVPGLADRASATRAKSIPAGTTLTMVRRLFFPFMIAFTLSFIRFPPKGVNNPLRTSSIWIKVRA